METIITIFLMAWVNQLTTDDYVAPSHQQSVTKLFSCNSHKLYRITWKTNTNTYQLLILYNEAHACKESASRTRYEHVLTNG